jgi:hypothetical protein
MKVRELIERLEGIDVDQEAEIYSRDTDGDFEEPYVEVSPTGNVFL